MAAHPDPENEHWPSLPLWASLHPGLSSKPRPLIRGTRMADLRPTPARSTGLVDVLDRVLDKGLVVAGDIKVSLAEVELLTIRIRLLVCSIDKAEQIGLDWWKFDHHLSPGKQALSAENEELRREIRV